MKKILKTGALVLGLIIGVFYMLFAADSFPQSFDYKSIVGFIIHCLPGLLIIVASWVAFKKPLTGFITFTVLTLVLTFYFRTYRDITYFMILSMPLIFISAILFPNITRNRVKE